MSRGIRHTCGWDKPRVVLMATEPLFKQN